jgi:hypothetical protein
MAAEIEQFTQQAIDQIVPRTVEHVVAVLHGTLGQLPPHTQVGDYAPALPSQLPCLTVSAEALSGRRAVLGNLLDTKQGAGALPPPSLSGKVDWGPVTGDAQPCHFAVSLWAITRAQLDSLRAALLEVDWTGRQAETAREVEYRWEETIEGAVMAFSRRLRHRWRFRQCRLASQSARYAAALDTPPPLVTVTTTAPLRSDASDASAEIGAAQPGAELELLGRSADGAWVQGGWHGGQTAWLKAESAALSVPLSLIPVVEGSVQGPAGGIQATAAGARGSSAWRQDVVYSAVLETAQEPVEETGDRIREIEITWRTDSGEASAGDPAVRRTKTVVEKEGKRIETYVEENL